MSEKKLLAHFDTNQGTFTIELFPDKAPITVANFRKLAESKFYDGTIFHRIIANFMIQGGDPQGTGFGGSDETIPDEFGEGLDFSQPGVLAMANAGPNTGSSQFFVTVVPTPWLQNHHSILVTSWNTMMSSKQSATSRRIFAISLSNRSYWNTYGLKKNKIFILKAVLLQWHLWSTAFVYVTMMGTSSFL